MTDWLTPDQQRAWRALLGMNTHLHAHLARALQGSSDLSYADFAVLVQLTEAPAGRALSARVHRRVPMPCRAALCRARPRCSRKPAPSRPIRAEIYFGMRDEARPAGRARISELADLLEWERSRLSHHLKRMESRGHIERSHCPEDGRGQYVAVTPVGRAAIAQAAPAHVELVRELVFEGMSDTELRAIIDVSERVAARLAQVPQKVT